MKITRIIKDATGRVGAFIIDECQGEETVLECKWFNSEKFAERWLKKR